ncbi:MAG: LuxR C-terminal-related transcriptional regulator [Anaerolineales bacterium]
MELIEAKIRVPALQQNHLPRPDLVKKISAETGRKLCLISTPAGYGKTRLLSEFATRLGKPVAWFLIDPKDNVSERFLFYLTASLLKTIPEMGNDLLEESKQANADDLESFIIKLIKRISGYGKDIHLILDEYHSITSQLINGAVEFLIENKPENLHIFILTRQLPQLPLVRWRARQELGEFKSHDLIFNERESREFLNGIMEFGLAEQELLRVSKAAQGWAVGIYLTALQFQRKAGKQSVTASLLNSKTNIMNYIKEEALGSIPQEVMSILYQISIVDSFSGGLCQAITLDPQSSKVLQDLEANGYFVSYVDQGRHWFTFHPMIADYLRQHLRQTEPSRVAEIYNRAADWFANNGDLEKAIYYAVKARNLDSAVRWMEGKAIEWIDKGQFEIFQANINHIPREMLLARPLLYAYFMLSLAESRKVEEFKSFYELVSADEFPPAAKVILDSASAAIKFVEGLYEQAIVVAKKNLAVIKQLQATAGEHAIATSTNLLVIVLSLASTNKYVAADDVCNTAVHFNLQYNLYGRAVACLSMKGGLKITYGKQGKAEEYFNQSYALVSRLKSPLSNQNELIPIAIRVCTPLSQLHYERNQLAQAEKYALIGLDSCQNNKESWQRRIMEISIVLARIKLAAGNYHAASEYLERIFQAENAIAFSPVMAFQKFSDILVQKMDLILQMANYKPYLYNLVADWGIENELENPDSNAAASVVWANYLILQNKPMEASRILRRLIAEAEKENLNGNLIRYLTLEALSQRQQDQLSKALAAIRKALILAEPEGYCRTFVDYGHPMLDLLTQAARQDGRGPYLDGLLETFNNEAKRSPETATQPNLQRLNYNEKQILSLMERGYTNKQIAEELHLSINTVKWYSYRIFSAFGVNNRHDAISMAKRLGVIQGPSN